MYNLTLYFPYTLYNINKIRYITFRCRGAYNAGFSHTDYRVLCTLNVSSYEPQIHERQVHAPLQYRTLQRGRQLAFHPHRFHSLTRVTRVFLYGTTIHTGHHCGLRTPAYRLEWIVSSAPCVAPRAASSPHAPTVRAAVLSRVRPTRVCARYALSLYSSAYLSLLLEGPRTAL